MTSGKPRICFVALNCYNLLSGRTDLTHIGGAEVQQVLIAKWLRDQGYPVSFVTHDHGQPDGEDCDGIRVYKAFEKHAGIPMLRFIYPRWFKMATAMGRADADIYYQRGAGVETGIVGDWCRRHGRKFIFTAANDADCTLDLHLLGSGRERVLYRHGLRSASHVIAQSKTQEALLAQSYGVTATVLRNCSLPQPDSQRVSAFNGRVLWVGRISPEKRPHWLLEVAARTPEVAFTMVGAQNVDSDYAQDVISRAAAMPNVNFVGRVPFDEMAAYYQDHSLLCSTSELEGFPNVYLEAWRVGIPTLSTFDPDGIVAESGAGWVVESIDDYVSVLNEFNAGTNAWHHASEAALECFRNNFTLEQNMPLLERDIARLVRKADAP